MLKHFLILTGVIISLSVICTLFIRSKTEIDYYNQLMISIDDRAILLGKQYFMGLKPISFSSLLNQNYQQFPTLVFHSIKYPDTRSAFFDENPNVHFNHSPYHNNPVADALGENECRVLTLSKGAIVSDPIILFKKPIILNQELKGYVELGFDGRDLYTKLDEANYLTVSIALLLILLSLGVIGLLSWLKHHIPLKVVASDKPDPKIITVVHQSSEKETLKNRMDPLNSSRNPPFPLSGKPHSNKTEKKSAKAKNEMNPSKEPKRAVFKLQREKPNDSKVDKPHTKVSLQTQEHHFVKQPPSIFSAFLNSKRPDHSPKAFRVQRLFTHATKAETESISGLDEFLLTTPPPLVDHHASAARMKLEERIENFSSFKPSSVKKPNVVVEDLGNKPNNLKKPRLSLLG